MAQLNAKLAESKSHLELEKQQLMKTKGEIDAYRPEVAIPDAEKHMEKREYQEALRSLAKLSKGERKQPKVRRMIDKATPELRQDRVAFSHEYEDSRLKIGEDYTVRASGPGDTTLTISYPLMNRPLVYQFENNRDLIARIRGLGFKKMFLMDGAQNRWFFDFE